jgi:hypothetical protein
MAWFSSARAAEAQVGVRLERAHSQLRRDGEGLSEQALGVIESRTLAMRGDLSELMDAIADKATLAP